MSEPRCQWDEHHPEFCKEHNDYVETLACRAVVKQLRVTVAELYRELHGVRERFADALTALSGVSGRPCPLCTYQEGKFLAPCAWHRETGEQARVIARLREALTRLLEAYDETEATYESVYGLLKKPSQMWEAARQALSPTEA